MIIPLVVVMVDDSVFELGAYRVMVNARFIYAEGSGDFPTDNDHRCLVANPLWAWHYRPLLLI